MHTLHIYILIAESEHTEKVLHVVAEVLKALSTVLYYKEAHQQSQTQKSHEIESRTAYRQRTITENHLRNYKDGLLYSQWKRQIY